MQEADVYNLIRQARNEISATRSNQLLQHAIELTKNIPKNPDILSARILQELAINSLSPLERKTHWDNAIRILEDSIKKISDYVTVQLYADIVIDAFQDPYTVFFDHVVRKRLANARCELEKFLHNRAVCNLEVFSSILAKLSSVIRAQALSQYTFANRYTVLDRARRTAKKALDLNEKNFAANLELASCFWLLARYTETDEEYNETLAKAEEQYLLAAHNKKNEIGSIALARFYRMTYQSSKACELYKSVSKHSINRRKVLRESFVLAEAVQHLWYQQYPDNFLSPLLQEAIVENQLSIDAGNRYARHIVDLATLYAISGDIEESKTILSTELKTTEGNLDWNSFVDILTSDIASEQDENDLLQQGLALGVNSPVVLNKIGTFCFDFLDDTNRALAFYNAALKLQPNNAMFLTNKARVLLKINDRSTYSEIDRLLQRAKSYADRRFTWWRAYLNELNNLRGYTIVPRKPGRTHGPRASFNDRRLDYYRIKRLGNPNARGLEYEKYIAALIDVSFTESRGSHLTPGAQNDAFFIHKETPFRVEVKWEKDPVSPRTIREFYARIDIAGMGGVFISHNGYREEAIGYGKRKLGEKCVLFVNGNEIERVVEGKVSIYDLIDLKYIAFYVEENPYKVFD